MKKPKRASAIAMASDIKSISHYRAAKMVSKSVPYGLSEQGQLYLTW